MALFFGDILPGFLSGFGSRWLKHCEERETSLSCLEQPVGLEYNFPLLILKILEKFYATLCIIVITSTSE